MFGVDSFVDEPASIDYEPFAHARRLGVEVAYSPLLPLDTMVAAYSRRRGTIYIRPGLAPTIERCAVAHEIVHHERGDVGAVPAQERRADRIAARRLVRPSRVLDELRTTPDPGAVALRLGVTERIMRAWLAHWSGSLRAEPGSVRGILRGRGLAA